MLSNQRGRAALVFAAAFIGIAAGLALTGCAPDAPTIPQVATFDVVGVNPVDGCTVTRFKRKQDGMIADDRGYYVICPTTKPAPKVIVAEHDESCGKNCTRHVSVTTVGAPDPASEVQ